MNVFLRGLCGQHRNASRSEYEYRKLPASSLQVASIDALTSFAHKHSSILMNITADMSASWCRMMVLPSTTRLFVAAGGDKGNELPKRPSLP